MALKIPSAKQQVSQTSLLCVTLKLTLLKKGGDWTGICSNNVQMQLTTAVEIEIQIRIYATVSCGKENHLPKTSRQILGTLARKNITENALFI